MAVKEVHGPGPRGARGPRPKVENPGKLLKRIMDEVFRNYLPHCILVLVCIVVSALANVQASLFLQTLMDDYIVPMTRQQNPSFAPLAGALVRMCCIYLVGILAAWANARIMVNVTQGTLRNLRTKLFTHMESLPIRYFDSHPHGDIMSVYTNDVDTLRQMLSQSIPQLVSSVITIVSVFFSMCMLSWQLTIVTMLMVALMLFCSKQIAKSSSKYFIQQQRDLGKVNGYIEEMMEGQKVHPRQRRGPDLLPRAAVHPGQGPDEHVHPRGRPRSRALQLRRHDYGQVHRPPAAVLRVCPRRGRFARPVAEHLA